MSYEIIYSKNFIKVGDEYIASIITGSSNCFECYNRRREHNYSFFGDSKKALFTKDELLNLYGDTTEENKNNECFVYNSKWIYHKDIKAFMDSGIKHAHTIEEYIKDGVLYWKKHKYNIECLTCYLLEYKDSKYTQFLIREIKTTDELKAWITEAVNYRDNNANKEHIYIDIAFNKDYKYYVADRITMKNNAEQKEFKGRAIIKYKNSYLVNWYSGYAFYKKLDTEKVRIFNSYDEAKNYINTTAEIGDYTKQFLRIINYDKLLKEKEKQVYYVYYDYAGYRYYINKHTGRGYYYSQCMERLFNYCNALKLLEKLKRNNKYEFKIGKVEAVR